MNREIKFRQYYQGDDDQFPEWIFFDLRHGHMTVDGGWEHPQQFTGLKDKNGKDIYEGDVVRVLYSDWISKSDNDPRTLDQYLKDLSGIGMVEFGESRFGVRFHAEGCLASIHVGHHGRMEVIGNLHENPELLSS